MNITEAKTLFKELHAPVKSIDAHVISIANYIHESIVDAKASVIVTFNKGMPFYVIEQIYNRFTELGFSCVATPEVKTSFLGITKINHATLLIYGWT